MARTSKNITIEGQFASGVLGAFNIIRGFASLQDLAAISAPFYFDPLTAQSGPATGHQRKIDDNHAEAIKRYLEAGRPCFIPEIILSIRVEFREELDPLAKPVGVISDTAPGLVVKRRWKSRQVTTHQIVVERSRLQILVETEGRIRRIDGNHRLHLAGQLAPDTTPSKTKYLAPFCAILLGPPGDANDDFVESMLFHTINSKAWKLDSEHALQLILRQATQFRTLDEEFSTDPPLHLTRLIKEKVDGMPQVQRSRLGDTPATMLNSAASAMVAQDSSLSQNRQNMATFADAMSGAITDILSRLPTTYPELCKADYFIELASLAWGETDQAIGQESRINQAVATLAGMGRWLGRDGMHNIQSKRSIAQQLFEIYRSLQSRIPKRVFLARWYPSDADGSEKTRADLRLAELRKVAVELGLELIDMGTQVGGTYQIPPAMYAAIDSSDIMLADLTGIRPNVMIEVGFALRVHSNGRMLLYYETTGGTKVPFDIAGFQYIPIDQAAEIHNKVKPALEAIILKAKAAVI
jgi:hypothetical protein